MSFSHCMIAAEASSRLFTEQFCECNTEKAVAASIWVLAKIDNMQHLFLLETFNLKNPRSSTRAGTRCLEAHFQISVGKRIWGARRFAKTFQLLHCSHLQAQ